MLGKILLLMLMILLIGCAAPTQEMPNTKQESTKSLSELQTDACNAAHDAHSCDTRLSDLGIVSKDQCCEVLNKCC